MKESREKTHKQIADGL